jgi:hypothetical protein
MCQRILRRHGERADAFSKGRSANPKLPISHRTRKKASVTGPKEIRRALTEGISKDGRRLKPPMVDYVADFKNWSNDEIDYLIAWIRTIPPID